jgi:hypothetical protein
MEGSMNFWRIKFFPCVLVLIVLLLVGCGEKVKQPVGSDTASLETQRDYVEGAISTIMTKMEWDVNAEIAKKIRTRRSLAVHILKDHTALMAYFQSKQWEKMDIVRGDKAKLYTFDSEGKKVLWDGKINVFWEKMYKEKAQAYSTAASIELELEVTHVTLDDVENPTKTLDCKSQEFYEFRVVCKDENGKVISNLKGVGSGIRCHSEDCPWYVCEI